MECEELSRTVVSMLALYGRYGIDPGLDPLVICYKHSKPIRNTKFLILI